MGGNITRFMRHWYVDSFLGTSHFMLDVFERLDRTFALKINARNLFKPLYQDATAVGYILGFLLRSLRVIIGSAVYFFVFLLSVVIYLAWLAVPLLIVWNIVKHYAR